MRFLITGDWHIDEDKIKTRKDNVLNTCLNKIGQIFQIARNNECQAILQPGDFFEHHRANDFLKQLLISFLKSDLGSVPIYTVFGQHDLRYHNSNVNNTPLKVLQSSGVVSILGEKPLVYPQDLVNVYGASWYEDIPKIWDTLIGTNILVLHKMIVDQKIWEGQEDHTYANLLLAKTKFDLIVSGDNHKHFVARSGKRFLINCGSLLRTRIDQEDHRPCVYIYDTEPEHGKPFLEQVFLDVDDFKDVIRVDEAKREKEDNEKLKEFIEALKVDAKLTGIKYRHNVYSYLEQNKDTIDSVTKYFIDLVFQRLDNKGL